MSNFLTAVGKKWHLVLVAGIVSAHSSSFAESQKLNCTSSDQNTPIGFTIKMAKKSNPCDPSDPTRMITDALIFLRDMQVEENGIARNFDQGLLDTKWLKRLHRLTPNIMSYRYDKFKTANTCNGRIAYTYFEVPGVMYFCDSYFRGKVIDQENREKTYLDLIFVMMHESRHLEGQEYPARDPRRGYRHTGCGQTHEGCDPSLGYQGAYAVDAEFASKIATLVVNLSPKSRQYAMDQAWVSAYQRLVDSPIKNNAKPWTEQVRQIRARFGSIPEEE